MKKDSPHLDVKRVRQNDGYTCGFRAATAIYDYYDRIKHPSNPYNFHSSKRAARKNLEANLGVENAPQGVLPHDLFLTLYNDGFSYETETDYKSFKKSLKKSIKRGHPAFIIADIKLTTITLGHWIVACGVDKTGLWIADSMSSNEAPELISDDDMIERFAGGVIIDRNKDSEPQDASWLERTQIYAEATLFCGKVGINNL